MYYKLTVLLNRLKYKLKTEAYHLKDYYGKTGPLTITKMSQVYAAFEQWNLVFMHTHAHSCLFTQATLKKLYAQKISLLHLNQIDQFELLLENYDSKTKKLVVFDLDDFNQADSRLVFIFGSVFPFFELFTNRPKASATNKYLANLAAYRKSKKLHYWLINENFLMFNGSKIKNLAEHFVAVSKMLGGTGIAIDSSDQLASFKDQSDLSQYHLILPLSVEVITANHNLIYQCMAACPKTTIVYFLDKSNLIWSTMFDSKLAFRNQLLNDAEKLVRNRLKF